MQRFQLKGKLAPRYIGPFKILNRRGEVSYQLELPEEMSAVHNVFHISLLRKCLEVSEKTEVSKNIDHRTIEINDDLTYPEIPIRILEESFRTTRTPKHHVSQDSVEQPDGRGSYLRARRSHQDGVSRSLQILGNLFRPFSNLGTRFF